MFSSLKINPDSLSLGCVDKGKEGKISRRLAREAAFENQREKERQHVHHVASSARDGVNCTNGIESDDDDCDDVDNNDDDEDDNDGDTDDDDYRPGSYGHERVREKKIKTRI